MKNHPSGRLVGTLILVAMAVSLIVPASEAGSRWKRSNGDWRNAGRGDRACSDHPAHRWFDGREYCGGKDAHGYWQTASRCEDRYGRKWVDNAEWVACHLGDGRDERRSYDRRWRDERDSYRNR